MVVTAHPSITRDPSVLSGEPVLRGTRTPVRAVVELWRLGVAPEEIPEHLAHLSLAQVFAALSYHADHSAEIQRYIDLNHGFKPTP
jgi:uncharacterized protein (DUF433 family)